MNSNKQVAIQKQIAYINNKNYGYQFNQSKA